MKKTLSALLLSLCSVNTFSAVGPSHVSGEISNLTSTNQGLMVRIGKNEVPNNCTSGRSWMLIEAQYQTMISTTLTAWALGKRATVYTSARTNGYCRVVQVDPSES